MIGFGQFAAGVGHRIEADVERAPAHRGELRVGLDQRGVRIDFGGKLAARPLGDFGGECPAEPVTKVALVDRAAGELVGDLQRGRGVRGTDAETENGGCGDCGRDQVTTREHGGSP